MVFCMFRCFVRGFFILKKKTTPPAHALAAWVFPARAVYPSDISDMNADRCVAVSGARPGSVPTRTQSGASQKNELHVIVSC